MYMFWNLIFFLFNSIIQLRDKKNLRFVDCCDKIVSNSSFGELNNSFQDSFNKILSQQLIHDRSCISVIVNYKLPELLPLFSLSSCPKYILPACAYRKSKYHTCKQLLPLNLFKLSSLWHRIKELQPAIFSDDMKMIFKQ